MSAVLSAIQAHRASYVAYTAIINAKPADTSATDRAGASERAALVSLLAAPVTTTTDAMHKASYLLDEVGQVEDYFAKTDLARSFLKSFVTPADPLFDLIAELRAYEATIDRMTDDEFNIACRKPHPSFERLRDDPPAATTMAGVEAALQLMADEDAKGNDWLRDGFLERTVLPFFRGRQGVGFQPDPLLAIVQCYRSQLAIFNTPTGKTDEEANAMRDATWGAFEEGVADGTINLPSPTTLAGAAAALRCALEEDTTHAVSDKLRDVALAFLEGAPQPAASLPRPTDPFLERIVRYRADVEAFNKRPDSPDEIDSEEPEPGVALRDELASGAVAIHSARGAAEALRQVIASDCIGDTTDEELVKAALAFLEGEGA
ncbi:hypothetical protein [Aureimonas psammosilenae]|uniref:hypothetical protein n=1 Tax=Aureimonas psammosilenae TaxID=2495496 RepID=UPI001260645F|nr:hypothetical protein [Aureimonas psammosilenae]